jgi:predicted ATP-grasp superfamily ATP-dependent carboligase
MMNLEEIRVFITDGYWRKTLAAVRGLGRMGVSVTVGESTYLAPACFSRYCHTRVRTPSPVLQPSDYLEFLEDYLSRHPHQVLLPMEEETLLLLARHRERFERITRLPVADHASLLMARDKVQVLQRAEALSIPIPKTYPVADLEAGRALLDILPYPVVVKPRLGSGSAGIEYVTEHTQLLPALQRAFAAAHAPFVQERLPADGPGIGVSFLLDDRHQVRASFVHRRLREYPVSGGPSTLRESCRHEEAHGYALRLLQDLNFVGIAMVEFKIDARTGKPKLLEVNPRFWGSLALAIDAGVNFPFLLTLMALERDFAPVNSYRIGHRCRWLLPGDILHFLQNPDRWHLEPSFFRFRAPHLTYDIIDAQDPGPILGTILALLPFYGSRDFVHVRGRRTG